MRKLIGFFACVAIGFAFYELLEKLRGNGGDDGGSRPKSAPRPGVGTMTGPGNGKRERTEDSDGTAVTHVVGRGVI